MNIQRYFLSLLTVLCFQVMIAQHVRVIAPKRVAVGEEFQIEYTVYTQDVRRFQLGAISSGLEKVYGPATSMQQSIGFVDGHTSSSSSISFTYVFVANKKGTFRIAPARVDVGGQMLASTPIRITATGNANVSRSSSTGGAYCGTDGDEDSHSSSAITSKDLFIKVSANKTTVYEQEPVLLTYKVYTTKNLKQLAGKMPDLAGFHVQEVSLPQQKTFHKERLNGRVYSTVTWSEYVMYPQMTGVLKIPALTFKGLIQVGDPDFNPFEAFGIDNSHDIQKNIIAPGLSIRVKPLPSKPINFSGGVGHFNISAQLDKKEVKAGDPISVRIVVSGCGNLKLIQQPKVLYPTSFEIYDVKITDKTRLTVKGTEGNMIYDQTVVPCKEGKFIINPINFTYFDVAQQKYVTVQTEKLLLKVLKGKGTDGKSSTDDLASLGSDIHPLKMNDSPFDIFNYNFFNSITYWFLIFILFVAIAGIAYFFREGFKNSSVDFSLKREKNANKTATCRLDAAYAMMLKGENIEFYEEISHTLWGYVSDKLHIAIGELSRENISEKLAAMNMPGDVTNKFISALDECEFQRYAPGDERGNMRRTYDTAIAAISSIENATKKKKKAGNMKSILFMLSFFMLSVLPSFGINQTKHDADVLYKKGHYAAAVQAYEFLLQKGASANLYYNLGNSYYKQDSITKAVIAYERALRLSPSDEDIKFNLQLAQSKTIDNIAPASEMFFVTWYKSLVNLLSIDGWAWISILSLLIIICGMGVFLWVKKLNFRKTLTKLLVVPIFTFIFSLFFAFQQKIIVSSHNFAIVTSPSVVVKTAPDAAASKAFIIHEGTKVEILDKSMDQWWEVTLEDGRRGWIEKGLTEVI